MKRSAVGMISWGGVLFVNCIVSSVILENKLILFLNLNGFFFFSFDEIFLIFE